MGSVIIHDQVQVQFGRRFGVDLLQEADEFLMPVAREAIADHFPIKHAEGGKQGGCAIAFVIVCHRPATPLLDRQSWLRPIKSLDLAFLIDRQDQGLVGWIEVEADNIRQLFEKVLVSAELEGLHQMRLEVVLSPYSSDRGFAEKNCGQVYEFYFSIMS